MQDIRKAVDGPQVKDACIGIKRIRPHTTDAWVKKARVLLREGWGRSPALHGSFSPKAQ